MQLSKRSLSAQLPRCAAATGASTARPVNGASGSGVTSEGAMSSS